MSAEKHLDPISYLAKSEETLAREANARRLVAQQRLEIEIQCLERWLADAKAQMNNIHEEWRSL